MGLLFKLAVATTAARAHAHAAHHRRGNRRLTRNESRYHSGKCKQTPKPSTESFLYPPFFSL